jgi:hypothetical protein
LPNDYIVTRKNAKVSKSNVKNFDDTLNHGIPHRIIRLLAELTDEEPQATVLGLGQFSPSTLDPGRLAASRQNRRKPNPSARPP